MATFFIKSLGDGQLPAAKAALYTVPALTTTIIKLMTLVNTDAVARTVNLYVKAGSGTSRRIIPKDLNLLAGYSMEFGESGEDITLEAGEMIEGDASAATVVDYTISGIEQA